MENQTERAYTAIERTVRYFLGDTSILLNYYEPEDLVQEVFCHFLEKKFFEKYDETITSFEYFVAKATKNHLIDKTRKRVHLMKSLSNPVRGKEGTEDATLADFVEERITDQHSALLLKELMENVSTNYISPNYDMTWKELLGYILQGMTPKEIRKYVNVSSACISQRRKQLIAQLV